ncbi:hypothetical protein ACFL4D_01225 [Candidatus Margulisiibacteriota bacterium]
MKQPLFRAIMTGLFLLGASLTVYANETSSAVANAHRYIILLGIVIYALLLTTLISGLNKWKLKTHKLFATLSICGATLHAALVLISR